MPVIIEECTITAKGQTTVPKAVRNALGVDYGGKIAFRVDERGVTVERVISEGDDPALGAFLDLLERDLAGRPDAIRRLTPALAKRIGDLVEGIEVDHDAPIEGEVAI